MRNQKASYQRFKSNLPKAVILVIAKAIIQKFAHSGSMLSLTLLQKVCGYFVHDYGK